MSIRVPLFLIGLLVAGSANSNAQQSDRPATRPDLFECDGCERATLHPPKTLSWRIGLAPDGEPGEKLRLTGSVLMPDGETPAPGVVLYFHQTNAAGLYKSNLSVARGGPNDGMIEGWLATDDDGRYEVVTIRPAPYPNLGAPAHIHVYVKEPERRSYYVDDFVFDSDPLVTTAYRADQQLRGGSGIVRLTRAEDGSWIANRDIVLEW